MDPILHFEVLLSKDRNQEGKLIVHKGTYTDRECRSEKIASFSVLGRGSRGNADTQFLENGNTPTGEFKVTKLQNKPKKKRRSYGMNGVFRLKPLGGNALKAERKYGRSGFLIHGGDLRKDKSLRPTNGCLRLHNGDVAKLKKLVQEIFDCTGACSSMNITVAVKEVI